LKLTKQQLYDRGRTLKGALRRSLRLTLHSSVDASRADALKLTSGNLSTAQLRAMGHPYARRHRNTLIPPLPINRQTGRLQASLRVFRRGEDRAQLQFTAPHARFVLAPQGTARMLPRGLWMELRRRHNARAAQRLRQHHHALRNAR
jgi:hypothetical protein